MSTTNPREPNCCASCGDEYGSSNLNADGVCRGCHNEADGLCWCGADPLPGYRMCGECSADQAADVRFHAMHEAGRRW